MSKRPVIPGELWPASKRQEIGVRGGMPFDVDRLTAMARTAVVSSRSEDETMTTAYGSTYPRITAVVHAACVAVDPYQSWTRSIGSASALFIRTDPYYIPPRGYATWNVSGSIVSYKLGVSNCVFSLVGINTALHQMAVSPGYEMTLDDVYDKYKLFGRTVTEKDDPHGRGGGERVMTVDLALGQNQLSHNCWDPEVPPMTCLFFAYLAESVVPETRATHDEQYRPSNGDLVVRVPKHTTPRPHAKPDDPQPFPYRVKIVPMVSSEKRLSQKQLMKPVELGPNKGTLLVPGRFIKFGTVMHNDVVSPDPLFVRSARTKLMMSDPNELKFGHRSMHFLDYHDATPTFEVLCSAASC